MSHFLEYEVQSGPNVPRGLPRLKLAVLSPIWRGTALNLEYPDGVRHNLVGWRGPGAGEPCDVQVFWTRHEPAGPAVCLAIGGDAGLRDLSPPEDPGSPRGRPFLALAASLIPAEVLEVIGPAPEAEKPQPPSPLLLT